MDATPTKICTKCGAELPATTEFFYPDKRGRFGLRAICKSCHQAERMAHYHSNKAAHQEASARWRAANPERAKELSRLNYHRHRAERQAQTAAWRKANPDKVNANKRRYREAHPEAYRDWYYANQDKAIASSHRWYQANIEQARQASRAWRANHPDIMRAHERNRRARLANAPGSHTAEETRLLRYLQDNKCAYCGEELPWNIKGGAHLDHKTPLSRGGSNDISNLAWACAACNLSKHDKTEDEFMGWST